MRYVDDGFVSAVERGEQIADVVVDDRYPFVDVETIADAASGGPADAAGIAARYSGLRGRLSDRDRPHLLVACGDLAPSEAWTEVLTANVADAGALVVPGDRDDAGFDALARRLSGRDRHRGLPVAAVLRVVGRERPRDLAYVAVVGYDSTRTDGDGGRVGESQTAAAARLVWALAHGVARRAPLYVVGVVHHDPLPADRDAPADAGVLVDAAAFVAHCRAVRMSLVVHGTMRHDAVRSLSEVPLRPMPAETGVPLAPAPAFALGVATSGLARIRLDLRRGEARMAYCKDGGTDGPGRAVEVVRPLVSASCISPGERMLRERLDEWHEEMSRDPRVGIEARAALDAFAAHVESTWERHGYVALCPPDVPMPDLPAPRDVRYRLLLLLRERGDGEYDVLLSNHTPLKISEFADWHALLVPAFTDVRGLLEHLKEDVVRHVTTRAEDVEKASRARRFEEAIDELLADEDLWRDEVEEVAKTTLLKFSPTNGCLTRYEYQLVVVRPLVARPEPGAQDARSRAVARVVEWLDELPAVRPAAGGDGLVPLDLLSGDSSGLRWTPPLEPARQDVPRVPPGAVWFPLAAPGKEPNWFACPSIVARNADVMRWIDGWLRRHRRPDGRFPNEIVLGAATAADDVFRIVEPWPYHGPGADPAPKSTVAALRRVHLSEEHDLGSIRPYANQEIVPVLLVRREAGDGRDVIVVARKEAAAPFGFRVEVPDDAVLGVLRPVQRYVLTAGMARAARVISDVVRFVDDPWGVARVLRGASPTAISVTPPIVEQVPRAERESDAERELLLCDGNHRVVHAVWNERLALPAVAALGEPVAPYYAYPFSRYEWWVTAENKRSTPPDPEWRYQTRRVPPDDRATARWDWYRRYFRDLESGFGPLGPQGGRPY